MQLKYKIDNNVVNSCHIHIRSYILSSTTKETNQHSKKIANDISSIKLLNEHIRQGGSTLALVDRIKSSRRDMESVIASAKLRRDSLLSSLQDKKQENLVVKEPTKPTVDTTASTQHVQSSVEKSQVANTQQESKESTSNLSTNDRNLGKGNALSTHQKPKHVQSSANTNSSNHSNTNGNNQVKPNSSVSKPIQQKSQPTLGATKKPSFNVVSKPAVSATPSYIKGSYTPPPKVAKSPMGQMLRERDFRNTNTTKVGVQGSNQSRPTSRPNTMGNSRPSQGVRPNIGAVSKPSHLPPAKDTRGKSNDKKKDYSKTSDNSKMSKRTLIRKGFISIDMDESRVGFRKLKNKKSKDSGQFVSAKIDKAIITTENLSVKILSEKIGKTAQEIIKQLMILGIMCSINSVVDFATMELVASELGVELELRLEKTKEEELEELHESATEIESNLSKRPPVVAVMGHVDHGKTSLLDAIRKTNVMSGEAGGITQHIGAYTAHAHGESITFLDTPGHEAFTQMRARGAKVTDIAILVVAADDGVMPQTIEAIDHIKAAGVPMIVAINKIDKVGANPQKVKEILTAHDVVSQEWGGDTVMVNVAAKTGDNITGLLEEIIFLAETLNLRANHNRTARGTIVEAKMDKGKGPMATIIVQNGTLKVGDIVVSGRSYGRIRGMTDWTGAKLRTAGPSTAVSVLGFNEVPSAGDGIFVVADEKLAKQVVSERDDKHKLQQQSLGTKVSLDDVFDRIKASQLKDLNLIIKADVQGSAEALHSSLLKLSSDEVRVKVIHSGVGAISKSDIMLAEVSKAIILGFNIKADAESKALADETGIDIRQYKIIYEAIDDITRAVKGLEKPVYRDIHLGRVQVRNVFKLSSHGTIAGSYVINGKVLRGAKAKVWRGTELVHEGVVTSLKRFKEDVREVGINYECGISLDGYDGFKVDDEIEIYTQEQINK